MTFGTSCALKRKGDEDQTTQQPPAKAVKNTGGPTTFPVRPGLKAAKDDHAFTIALERHLTKLKPHEKKTFNAAYRDISPQGLIAAVKSFDEENCRASRCSPLVAKSFGILEQFMRSITICLQSSPEVSALVIGGVRLLIDVAVKYITFFPKLASMISQLTQYLDVVKTFVDRTDNDGASESAIILKCAVALYGDWLDFCKEACSVFLDKKGHRRRLTCIRIFLRVQWDPFEATFGDINGRFKDHLDLLLHSSQAAQYNDIKELIARFEAAYTAQEEKDVTTTRRDFMHWISVLDFDDDHERILSRKHPGTGDWLLQRHDFQSWMNSSVSQLLWCYGKPGSGKSVLASHTLEHITWRAALNKRIGIAFCYFNYKQADNQKPRNIMSAFLKQLCWKRHILPPRLITFYQKHVLDARTPSYDAVQDALANLADEFDEIYFVIDALDECEQHLREQLITSIVDLCQGHSCMKAFITSRPETDIARIFGRLETPAVCVRARNTAEDIRKYVGDNVTALIKAERLELEDLNLASTIIETLVSKADGMFLWVYLQLQSLCRQRSDHDILQELNNLPLDLYETYHRILRIIDAHPPTLRALAQRCLSLVFFAARPFRMPELIDLAAVTAGFDEMQRQDMNRYTSKAILEASANLLVEDEGIVRPSHFSVQEYFSTTKNNDPELSKYFLSPEEGHAQAATACLRYLTLHFLRGGPCGTKFSLENRLDRYPCARYTSQYFDYHIAALNEVPNDLRCRLEKFLSQPQRVLSAALQLRRLRRGSHARLVADEYNDLPWPANARSFIEGTRLHSIEYIRSDSPCWNEPPLPEIFHQACFEGLLDVVQHLIQQNKWEQWKNHGPSYLSLADNQRLTPIYYAAKGGSPEVCRLLITSKASIYVGNQVVPWAYAVPRILEQGQGFMYRKAVRAALEMGHAGAARVLSFQVNNSWITKECLAVAAFEGREAMLRILLENIHSNTACEPDILAPAIQVAASKGFYSIIRLLCTNKPRATGLLCGSALHLCCESGDDKSAEVLLDSNANPNIRHMDAQLELPADLTEDEDHENELRFARSDKFPLQIAVEKKNASLTRKLLESGANLNDCDGYCSPLMWIIENKKGFYSHIIDVLREYGAEPRNPAHRITADRPYRFGVEVPTREFLSWDEIYRPVQELFPPAINSTGSNPLYDPEVAGPQSYTTDTKAPWTLD